MEETTHTSNENEVKSEQVLRKGEAPIKKEYLKPIVPKSKEEIEKGKKELAESRNEDRSFKKRPRDAKKEAPENTLCPRIASGKGCQFGEEKCKFSHDVEDFWKRRLKDLDGKCPIFEAEGYCKYGLLCRFGKSHMNMETKQNIEAGDGKEPSPEINSMTHELRTQLRKKKYPFKSVEMWNKHKKKGGEKKRDSVSADGEKKKESLEPVKEAVNIPESKNIDFKNKVYVAPLTTVGNLPFRRVMKQLGTDITCGEMAMANNLLQAQQSEWALVRRHKSEDIFGIQIAGAHGDQISRCCELLTRETSVDFIDLNMGCPIDLVVREGSGAALMNRTHKLESVIRGALTGIELGSLENNQNPCLTVKMRTGWSNKTPLAHTLVPRIEKLRSSMEFVNSSIVSSLHSQQPVTAIAIHGRSRLMRYTKTADWDYIISAANERKMETSHHTGVIGNGDVLSYEEFHEHLSSGALDTCMLARGALIKPWLPTEIKERRHWDISASERLDILKDFVNYGLEHWGSDQMGVNKTRRYFLEWQSFLCRYIPVGVLEYLPQHINDRPAQYYGRNDLETLMGSDQANDWVKLSEMLLGPVPCDFKFVPKHRANAYNNGSDTQP